MATPTDPQTGGDWFDTQGPPAAPAAWDGPRPRWHFYVTLRAPTGETRPVPTEQVDFYLARGATRL